MNTAIPHCLALGFLVKSESMFPLSSEEDYMSEE